MRRINVITHLLIIKGDKNIMDLLRRLGSGKNIKLFYFLSNVLNYCIPKFIFRLRLNSVLRSKYATDIEVIKRVNYYNKLSTKKTLPEGSLLLKDHKYKNKQNQSVYFFDSYIYTRWFAGNLKWDKAFGDVTYIPERPAIVKSRPIAGDNENSVVLNLDKVRHFTFLDDKIKFEDKKDLVIFRGKVSNKLRRREFVDMYINHPMCDLGETSNRNLTPSEWKRANLTLWDHLDFKFIMALEGNDVASNLKWIMSSNSLAVMPRPIYETWFMEGQLIPNIHYVEIKDDYSDLEERLKYYIKNPDKAKIIIKNANEYVSKFRCKKKEKVVSLLVMQKYLEKTN